MAKNYSGIHDLINVYSLTGDISKSEAERRIRSMLSILKSELLDDEKDGIQIIDFLTLKKIHRKEKLARNPQNPSKEIIVPSRVNIKCELGKQFYKELNELS